MDTSAKKLLLLLLLLLATAVAVVVYSAPPLPFPLAFFFFSIVIIVTGPTCFYKRAEERGREGDRFCDRIAVLHYAV